MMAIVRVPTSASPSNRVRRLMLGVRFTMGAKMIRYAGRPDGIGGNGNNVHRMLNELAWWESVGARILHRDSVQGR